MCYYFIYMFKIKIISARVYGTRVPEVQVRRSANNDVGWAAVRPTAATARGGVNVLGEVHIKHGGG